MIRISVYLFLSIAWIAMALSQEQEIRAVLDKQVQAWNNGDMEGYMDGYWKSDSLLFTSGGNIQRGWQATLEKYKKGYSTKAKMGTLRFSQLEIYLLSQESAWVFGHWELEREKDHPQGVFTLVFKKCSGGWKIVHDHTSVETAQNTKTKK